LQKESALVLIVMLDVIPLAGVARYTYRDVIAFLVRPSQQEIAAGEQAIDQLEARADATDNLIAAVEPCARRRGFAEVCVTVTDRWRLVPDRARVAAQLWQT
jgi:hypothetical protein